MHPYPARGTNLFTVCKLYCCHGDNLCVPLVTRNIIWMLLLVLPWLQGDDAQDDAESTAGTVLRAAVHVRWAVQPATAGRRGDRATDVSWSLWTSVVWVSMCYVLGFMIIMDVSSMSMGHVLGFMIITDVSSMSEYGPRTWVHDHYGRQ